MHLAPAGLGKRNLRNNGQHTVLLRGLERYLTGERGNKNERIHKLPPKKNRAYALFFCSTDLELVLMSSSVVAETNLLYQHRRAVSGLVNGCGVAAAALRYGDFSITRIPLVDSGVVAEALLGQLDGAVVSALANICTVTEAALTNSYFRVTGISLQCKRGVTAAVLVNAQG